MSGHQQLEPTRNLAHAPEQNATSAPGPFPLPLWKQMKREPRLATVSQLRGLISWANQGVEEMRDSSPSCSPGTLYEAPGPTMAYIGVEEMARSLCEPLPVLIDCIDPVCNCKLPYSLTPFPYSMRDYVLDNPDIVTIGGLRGVIAWAADGLAVLGTERKEDEWRDLGFNDEYWKWDWDEVYGVTARKYPMGQWSDLLVDEMGEVGSGSLARESVATTS
ncbi:uncharacterized protein DNG_01825 [Cephalotrichum gorgonifer]|uniref:Uncharacterized protein n=1 Tax=Cephalotrichum gorgonifer TaxID=2041049 RepID=A0AAE8SSM0_9PEZI|nr:uncharacterized protein DNG_01825 [Cephalotrichum gorgonifer]